MRMFGSPYGCVVFADSAIYVEGCLRHQTQDGSQIRLLPTTPAFGSKSLRELIRDGVFQMLEQM